MFLSTNTCEGLGECIKECPTKAIRFINGKSFSCLTCGACYEICPNNAIFITKFGGFAVDRLKCNACGMCMFHCPTNNIKIEDGVVYGICSRCGLCETVCPTNSRVDGFSLVKDKQLNFIKSLNCTLPSYDFPSKSKQEVKERKYYGTDLDKCIFCGRCEYYCPTDAIDVNIDRSEGICTECRVCEDVCPTNSIKNRIINHDTCTLCLSCYNTCPNDAIVLSDFEVNITKINQKATGNIVSCLNCGLCSDTLDIDSLKNDGGKLRYDPTKEKVDDIKNRAKAINICPVSTLKEDFNKSIINDEGKVINPLKGFCVLCGKCFNVCDDVNAREYKTFKWDGSVSDECISCGTCAEICPKDAIILNRGSITVNLDKCILCENCAVHCPKNAIPKSTMRKKVIINGFNQIDQNLCIQCELCYKICPEEAIFKENGKLFVNEDKCIYCGACKSACPSNAFLFDRAFKNFVEGVK